MDVADRWVLCNILAPSELRDYLGDLRQGFAMSTGCGFTLIQAALKPPFKGVTGVATKFLE